MRLRSKGPDERSSKSGQFSSSHGRTPVSSVNRSEGRSSSANGSGGEVISDLAVCNSRKSSSQGRHVTNFQFHDPSDIYGNDNDDAGSVVSQRSSGSMSTLTNSISTLSYFRSLRKDREHMSVKTEDPSKMYARRRFQALLDSRRPTVSFDLANESPSNASRIPRNSPLSPSSTAVIKDNGAFVLPRTDNASDKSPHSRKSAKDYSYDSNSKNNSILQRSRDSSSSQKYTEDILRQVVASNVQAPVIMETPSYMAEQDQELEVIHSCSFSQRDTDYQDQGDVRSRDMYHRASGSEGSNSQSRRDKLINTIQALAVELATLDDDETEEHQDNDAASIVDVLSQADLRSVASQNRATILRDKLEAIIESERNSPQSLSSHRSKSVLSRGSGKSTSRSGYSRKSSQIQASANEHAKREYRNKIIDEIVATFVDSVDDTEFTSLSTAVRRQEEAMAKEQPYVKQPLFSFGSGASRSDIRPSSQPSSRKSRNRLPNQYR